MDTHSHRNTYSNSAIDAFLHKAEAKAKARAKAKAEAKVES